MTTTLDSALLRTLPLPSAVGDKDSRGRVLVIAGCPETPGAAVLAAESALRAGAGKLQVATARSLAPLLGALIPEALVIGLAETEDGGLIADERLLQRAAGADAVLLGPGMADAEATDALLRRLLDAVPDGSLVFDAAALASLPAHAARLRSRARPAIITPHAGEMAGMLGRARADVEAAAEDVAREASTRLGCVVALKGPTTHIAAPDGRRFIHPEGHAGLGTSGSGDVLAGAITGVLARGGDPVQAALWGVWAHGAAGRRLGGRIGPVGYLARELPPEIPTVLAEVEA